MSQWVSPREMVQALYKKGLTYRRIARESDVAFTAVLRIANGSTRAPREETEEAIQRLYAKYIGVSKSN